MHLFILCRIKPKIIMDKHNENNELIIESIDITNTDDLNDQKNDNEISSDEDYFIDNNDSYSFDAQVNKKPPTDDTIFLASRIQEPVNCDICKKKFYDLTLLYEHKMKNIQCTGTSFLCGVCDETIYGNEDTDEENNIRIHIRTHLLKKRYFCQHCERYEKSSIITQDFHVLNLLGVKHFICLLCRQTFSTLFEKSIHECDNHLKEIVANSDKKIIQKSVCELCGKLVSSMLCHMKYHNNIRPYQCNLCDNSFRTKFQIFRHQQAHKRRAIACNMCERKFYWLETFSNHLKKCHQFNKETIAYKCKHCKSKFYYKQELLEHEQIHRPYECKNCVETFQDLFELQDHHNNEHAELEFVKQPEFYTKTCNSKGESIDKYYVDNNKPLKTNKSSKLSPVKRVKISLSSSSLVKKEVSPSTSKNTSSSQLVDAIKNEVSLFAPDNTKEVVLKKVLFVCVQCKMGFKNELLLIEHRTQKHNVKYRCKTCGTETTDIAEHIIKHRRCLICKITFSSFALLKDHNANMHKD